MATFKSVLLTTLVFLSLYARLCVFYPVNQTDDEKLAVLRGTRVKREVLFSALDIAKQHGLAAIKKELGLNVIQAETATGVVLGTLCLLGFVMAGVYIYFKFMSF